MKDIPVLYVFRFENGAKEKALKRLNCSLECIMKQTQNVYLLNASEEKVTLPNIHVINKSQSGPFNKSVLINHMVKYYLCGCEYILLSDIDLIYQSDYYERIQEYAESKEPVRVIPYNIGTFSEWYESDFEEAMKKVNKEPRSFASGMSLGNGLVHIPSFIKIKGYNEQYVGYAGEDVEFNLRIGKINKTIFDENLKEIHLFHEPFNREYVEENIQLFMKVKKQIDEGGSLIMNDKWGEYA
jgi:predicted glycosyltransferase involved in capsule biosynthesis